MRAWLTSLFVLVASLAAAQPAPPATQTASLTATTCPGTGCTTLNVSGYGSIAIQLTGFGTATAQFEGSIDGSTYLALNATPINGTTAVTSTTASGVWFAAAAGLRLVRVRLSAYTSGTIVVTLQGALSGGASGGGGGGGSGPSGTIGAAVPATASPVAVKDNAGNLAYPTLDVSGNLLVAVTGAGSGGTSSTDGATYTAGTTAGTPLMVAKDDTSPTALAEDKVGVARGDANRDVFTVLRDAALNQRGVNVTAGNALTVDGSAVTQPVNTAQIAGTTTAVNTGNASAGTQRVVLASNQPIVLVDASNTTVPVALQGGTETLGTTLAAVTANTTGTGVSATGYAGLTFEVNCASCAGGTTVSFEGSSDAVNYVSVLAQQVGGTTIASSTTTAGRTAWMTPVPAGFDLWRANVTNYSAGTITVRIWASPVTGQPQSVNANVIGTVTVTDGAGALNTIVDSGTLTTVSTVTNLAQLNGAAISMNTGVRDAGTQRVTIATNDVVPASQSGTWNVGTVTTLTGITNVVHIDDNAGSLTVDGTVTTTPPANASTNVAQFGGTNVSTGTGAGGAGIPRVTVSNDSTVGLVAGAALIGKVGIDQTTPGTTNRVDVGVFPDNEPFNVAQFGGTNISTGTGASGAGIPRMTVANDSNILATQSGTWTVAQGTPAATTSAWPIKITDSAGAYTASVRSDGSEQVFCTNCGSGLTVQQGSLKTPVLGLRLVGAVGQSLGDANPLKTIVTNLDPCQDFTRAGSIAISQAANALLITGQAGKRILICHYAVVGADAENLSLVEGTGATCGTATLAVVGGATAANGMNFAAGGGMVAGEGQTWVALTGVPGNSLCLLQSGSGRVAGGLKYAFLY